MPVIIAILNQKGGAGKTTLSTNIACAIHQRGGNVLLVDSDPQGSSRDWKSVGESPLPVIGLDRPTLAKDLPAVTHGYDIVIIDGAPQLKDRAASAVKVAHAVLIPMQPSPYDIWAASDLIDIIKARQEVTDGQLKAAFVISRAIKNTTLTGEIHEVLQDYGLPVLKHGTTQRVAYAKSAAPGASVLDWNDPQAKTEINDLVDELEAWL